MASEATAKDQETYEFAWLMRPCEEYHGEYKDCSGIRGRFNQYFTYGEIQDCMHWKLANRNCLVYRKNRDSYALQQVVGFEQRRMQERLAGNLRNNVWEKRDAPPADWNAPLPEALAKRCETSYITRMQQQKDADERSAREQATNAEPQ